MSISTKIINVVDKKNIKKPKLEFLCVGTDRITGDALGPIVGSNIKEFINENNIKNVTVIGSLEKPLDNIEVSKYKKEKNKIVIVIDSAVSNTYSVGDIITKESNIKIRNAIKDEKEIQSDIAIKAVVSKNLGDENLNFLMLQNVELNIVIKLSKKISNEVYKVIKKYNT